MVNAILEVAERPRVFHTTARGDGVVPNLHIVPASARVNHERRARRACAESLIADFKTDDNPTALGV
jgi:hypothetical protein